MSSEEDRYIRALKYAETKDEFTLPEITDAIGLSDLQEKQFALQIMQGQLFHHNWSTYLFSYRSPQGDDADLKLHMSVEDKFRLIDYIELQEARAAGQSATKFAIGAIIVSILSTGVSGWLAYQQLTSDVNLPPKFMEKVNAATAQQAESTNQLKAIAASLHRSEEKRAAQESFVGLSQPKAAPRVISPPSSAGKGSRD